MGMAAQTVTLCFRMPQLVLLGVALLLHPTAAVEARPDLSGRRPYVSELTALKALPDVQGAYGMVRRTGTNKLREFGKCVSRELRSHFLSYVCLAYGTTMIAYTIFIYSTACPTTLTKKFLPALFVLLHIRQASGVCMCHTTAA